MRSLRCSVRSIVLGVGLCMPLLSDAQVPDHRISVSDAMGIPGSERSVTVTLTSTNAGVIGYQFDVCHDAIVDIEFGDVVLGSGVDGRDFATHLITFENGGWSVSATLTAGGELPSGEVHELYVAVYELLELGETELAFCGSYLEPRVTPAGGADEVEPETDGGRIEVLDPALGPLFLRGDADANGRIELLLDAYAIMQAASAGEEPPCADAADVNNSGVVTGIDTFYLFSHRVFGTSIDAPGSEECGFDPEAGDAGCLIPPDPCTTDPLPLAPDPAAWLEISTEPGPIAASELATVTVTLSVEGDALQAFSFAVCHDPGLRFDGFADLTVQDEYQASGFDAGIYGIGFPTFDDGWGGYGYWDVAWMEEGEYELFEARYEVIAGGPSEIWICETLGDPPLETRALRDGELIRPSTVSGGINCDPCGEPPAAAAFRRGDVDGDGDTSALLDAVYLLDWGFTDGKEPPCLDAADIDDSGEISPLLDGLFLLQWQFLSGDAPPAPGPATCGLDPDGNEDGVYCAQPPATCP